MKLKFRSDINGLRAYAVIGVIIFHFFPNLLGGGFAGVDVFFVISGYLMTVIIFNGVDTGSFSLIRFYLSRANRIIPPLAVLCTFIFIWGFFFLPIYDFRIVGRDLFGAITFTSNVIFSLKQDYFEGDTNFLLHTWSLAAEWQFYIFYPLIILVAKKITNLRFTKYLLLFLFVFSLVCSVIYSSLYPSESYYLLPTRAWEMLAGGLAFLFPFSFKVKEGRAVEILGIILVISSYLLIDEQTIWPGYMALLPVFGTYLVILSSSHTSVFTGNFVAQYIGRWSYSIYLWHWPVAVCFSYYFIPEDLKVIGLLLSIALGFLSYKYIESFSFKPFKLSSAAFAHVITVFVISTVSLVTYLTNGIAFKENLTSNSLVYGGMNDDYNQSEGSQLINTSDSYDYVMIGDSKAGHLVRGILKSGDKVKLSWYSDCMSFPSAYTFSNSFGKSWDIQCKENHRLLENSSSDIIISQRWNRFTDPNFKFFCSIENCNFNNDYETDLALLLTQLIDAINRDRNIYIIGELPRSDDERIEACLRSAAIFDLSLSCNIEAKPIQGVEKINKLLREVADTRENVFFVDSSGAICDFGNCKYGYENKPIFQPDLSHLTGLGAEIFWTHIITQISEVEIKQRAEK